MIQYFWNNNRDHQAIIDHFFANLVIVGTTDTIPGLYVRATPEGFVALNHIKTRTQKPYLLLVPDLTTVASLISQSNATLLLPFMQQCWPGPITIICNAASKVPQYMTSSSHTIALRIPAHKALRSVLAQTGPVFSTSANFHGAPTPTSVAEIDPQLLVHVTAVIDDKQTHELVASTMLDCTDPHAPRVVRAGSYDIGQLEMMYGKKFLFS